MALFKSLESQEDNKSQKIVNSEAEKVKCLIIGSGPAGYTAAIYAARANLSPLMYEGLEPGGQLTTTNDVENFPGYPEGVTGPVMMEELKAQAQRFGTDVRFGLATATDLSSRPFKVTIDGNKLIEAEVLIIATGATAKYLGLESEEKFKGQGVSACATCDGFFYKGKDVAVVGGGDTAAEEATYLAGICNKVYLIVRKDYLRASKVMVDRVMKTKNIEVLFEHTTKEIVGDMTGVNGVLLTNGKGEEVKKDIHGFFVAIGHKPNSDIFADYLETDEVGYIATEPGSTKTKVEGVFACGDVMDSEYRQAITAAGSGCKAAMDAERFLGAQL
ncbi:MAG: thioredoxin-disulfide reductase [Bacteroidales bacterium]|nr:thioredoxin-disulfide reductase [Bacteroidales bacterium]